MPGNSEKIHKGDKIGARFLRDISDRADLAARMVGINGIAVKVENGRIVVSGEKGLKRPSEPGMFMSVVNVGTTDLDIYSVAGLGDNFYKTRPNSLGSRILEVQEPKAYNAGNFVVTLERIPQDRMGLAYFSGVCLVRLVRQFDGPLLNRADCIAGEQALRASINGPVRILWEETTDPEGEALDPEEEHLAVVHWDGRGDTYLDWVNGGAGTVAHGCPVSGSGLDSGRFNLARPTKDGEGLLNVNVGGPVANGEFGKILLGDGPFLVRLNGVAIGGTTCGSLASSLETFANGSIFWRILAYLGTNVAEEHWAIIQRDSMATLMKATDDVIGDAIDCEVVTEDGVGSGVTLNLPVTWI